MLPVGTLIACFVSQWHNRQESEAHLIAKAYEEVKRIAVEEFGTLVDVTISFSFDGETGKVSYCLSRSISQNGANT